MSYCWGDGGGLKALRSNLSKLLEEIDEDELPATIRDAIELARFLGVQYLWIDALCIIQDDTRDWLNESAQMSSVYSQAFLTIAASSVDSSRFSFLHQSRRNIEALFPVQKENTSSQHQSSADDNSATMVGVRRSPYSGFHQDPARGIVDPSMCRAWTLQEYMLSTRVISFSTDELQWTCRTLRACECGYPEEIGSPRMEELQRSLETKENVELMEGANEGRLDRISTCLDFWNKVVEGYCRRDLSWMRDKLPALSGVAHEFARIFDKKELTSTGDLPPLRYLAGLWDTNIHRQLCWRRGNSSGDDIIEEYRAPTWSWASVEGDVIMNYSNMNVFVPQAEILEANCALANPNDPFGQVVRKDTYIRVRATVLETQMKIIRRAPGWGEDYQTVYGDINLDCSLDDTPPNTPIWGHHNAGRTVQRRRGPNDIIRDNVEQSASRSSSPGSDTGSDAESERERWHSPWEWVESNLGEQFTVWLLHMADINAFGGKRGEVLVLCRPTGDQEVYERIGHLFALEGSTWTEDVSGQAKSFVTIV